MSAHSELVAAAYEAKIWWTSYGEDAWVFGAKLFKKKPRFVVLAEKALETEGFESEHHPVAVLTRRGIKMRQPVRESRPRPSAVFGV